MNTRHFIFDLETSAFDREASDSFIRKNGGLNYVQEFLSASRDPARMQAHPLFRAHDKSQIVQLYSDNVFAQGDRGWVKVDRELFGNEYIGNRTFWESDFSRKHGFLGKAEKFGTQTEVERVEALYGAMQRELEAGNSVVLGGHNTSRFDFWKLEHATYQNEALSHRRGQLARWSDEYGSKFRLRDTLAELHDKAFTLAKEDSEFRLKHYGGAASAAEGFRVKGGNLGNVGRVMGRTFVAHDAVEDTGVAGGLGGLLDEGRVDGGFLRSVFEQEARAEESIAAEEVKAVVKSAGEFSAGELKLLKYGAAGVAAAGVVATYLAMSRRRDRQTQITGLRDEGMAMKMRHRLTSFGSGWRGLDPQLESEDAYNPWLRGAGVAAAGGALYGTHRMMLSSTPQYSKTLMKWAERFEDRSPRQMLRTFGISDRLSSYVTPEKLVYTRGMLTRRDGHTLNEVGETFQRQFHSAGLDFDLISEVTTDNPLVFEGRRSSSSAHMLLVGREGVNFETRFVNANSRLAGAAARLNSPLHPVEWARSDSDSFLGRQAENFKNFRGAQRIHNWAPWEKSMLGNPATGFRPFHSRTFGGADIVEDAKNVGRSAWSRLQVEALEAVERPQSSVFSKIGLGLERGAWNKAFHIPFAGEGGMVNAMLSRRVLPIALAVTGLGWLDYKLGHPSDKAIDAGLKANVLRADLTDMVPGGRAVTSFYDKVVPGPQYGPLALPAAGAFIGGLIHYKRVLKGEFETPELRKAGARLIPEMSEIREWMAEGNKVVSTTGLKKIWSLLGTPGKGAAIGLGLMLPFIPGMLGSRKSGAELRDVYSGMDPVPVRSGRWWEIGSTPYEGTRIKAWRPHWSILHKSRAEDISLYGSEDEKWRHNPILHPLRWLRDPYWLEKHNYDERPYPVASPAFSNVPLVGPLLAATLGKLVKPPVRMHEDQWDGQQYTLYSTRIEPKGQNAVPVPAPGDEFTLGEAFKKEARIGREYTGLWGFTLGSMWDAVFPDQDKGKEVFFQGSRQMDSTSRRYYERELGAGMAPSPGIEELFGYTEPLRRFVQREDFSPQANEIPNNMPSWIPGDDYYVNFRKGDPFIKLDDGYARLPGAGYEALHPELADVDREAYPDIHKLSILGDIAPYSREYNTYRERVAEQSRDNTALRIEYEKILNRVRETKDSGIRMDDRKFTAPVEEIAGTVQAVSPYGVQLAEFPGRRFQFSSVGLSAADMSAAIIGEHNNLTKQEIADEVDRRRAGLQEFLSGKMSAGTSVRLVVPKGVTNSSEQIRSVILSGSDNINAELIEQGFGQYREDLGGGEGRAMHGFFGRTVGALAEGLSFQGNDSSAFNPMRYVPSPWHTKLWQERTPLSQYINSEVSGTRMRRWERPIHDFLMPYLRGGMQRLTGQVVVPEDVQFRRDLNTLSDTLSYLRDLNGKASGSYTSKLQRTSTGANLFASPIFVGSTLPARESRFYREFLNETDPDKRAEILEVASPELQRALEAQWVASEARIAAAEGKDVGPIGENGRLYTKANLEEYDKAHTKLDYGDWVRSKEVADFFSRTGFKLPDADSEAFDEALDYQDVQLKIIQQEGYDAHDFNIFDDRAALLWRKPYVDGAVRELTSGEDRSAEELRRTVEQLMLSVNDRNPDVRAVVHAGRSDSTSVKVTANVDQTDELVTRIRRDPDQYRDS